jgi:transposase-like protein
MARARKASTVIVIPRDREGELEPLVVKRHQTNVTGIEDQIVVYMLKESVRGRFKFSIFNLVLFYQALVLV